MKYDPERKRYVGEDGSELKVTPYSDGSGYKYDYYDKNTYGNAQHNSTHVKSDSNENWSRTDNDRDNGTQEKSSGNGCYLTTACMKHYMADFDDNCYYLDILRWFRDEFVSLEDKKEYYEIAPKVVEEIDKSSDVDEVYKNIYYKVVQLCVRLIEYGRYEEAYNIYKENVIELENKYVKELVLN